MLSVDINCDTGEGIGNDESLMPLISSASIACGYHAGDELTMRQTVDLCIKYNVAIGAHPSFSDRENFGRSEIELPANVIYDIVTDQVKSLLKIVKEKSAKLHHVKPHGALYNMAAKDPVLAATIATAVKDIDASIILYGLANSGSISEARRIGLQTASEVFADRTYQDNGTLTSRKESNALIADSEAAITQVLQMIKNKTVRAVSGKIIPIHADTICIHGDGKHAIAFATRIQDQLKKEGIEIKAI